MRAPDQSESSFSVDLDVYQGPFEVLLGMLANRRLELTQIALGDITEEFLRYVASLDLTTSMDEASSFLDVASILVEAKSAALLPDYISQGGEQESMEALRERDLLFARLLQYKAFKEAGERFGLELTKNAASYPHPGMIDPETAQALPELVWTTQPGELAQLAARVLANAPASQVTLRQLHVPLVDLNAQTQLVRHTLMSQAGEALSFSSLIADAKSRLEVVARFVAVLLLFRRRDIQYKQEGPFQPLYLRWVADQEADRELDPVDQEDFS